MGSKQRDKGRIPGQFVPLLHATMDTPAWKALSHGAKWLYVELKRRRPRDRNTSYLSTRLAAQELNAGRPKIREWYAELQHYGFIVLAVPGCLGVDGKGKAPHWRLTEAGCTSRASAEGIFEPPTQEFLKWDGRPFDPKPFRRESKWAKTESRTPRDDHPGTHVMTTPGCASVPPKSRSGTHVVAIEQDTGGPHVVAISRLTTTGESESRSEPASNLSLPASNEGQNHVGHFEDPRLVALEATELRIRGEQRGRKKRTA